ncbi:MAG: 4Fe-4S dicluster domain-containing protein [Spirochaetia bacterium]|nr:4Fe-4S dicluster domain-containing protein [Spirochaetia bacterium]
MIFKTITKENLKTFISNVIEKNSTFAPVITSRDSENKPVYQFKEVESFEEIEIDYTKSYSSIKNFFLPFKENLSTFDFNEGSWEQNINYTVHPRVIFGVRACDINALLKLDQVFLQGKFPHPSYAARRKNTFIIGLDHEPMEDCFCRSLDTDEAVHGFDIFLTDIGSKYFMLINSSKAFNLLQNTEVEDVTEKDREHYIKEKNRLASLFQTQVEITGMANLMDLEFESDVWQKWGDKCLSCGSCAMVCPTCYCYNVCEKIDLSLRKSSKEKMLYSCNLIDFAEVAGGHNFREKSSSRLKYRYYHQHRGFVESFDESKCVGCNRCRKACPAGINPVEVIKDLRMQRQENE